MYSFTICSSSALDGGWVVNAMPLPLNLHYRTLVPTVQEAWWPSGPV